MKTSVGPLRLSLGTQALLFVSCLCVTAWMWSAPCAHAGEKRAKDDKAIASGDKTLKERHSDLTNEWKASKRKGTTAEKAAILKKATALYNDASADDELRMKVLSFVGTAAKGTKGDEVRTMVLHTLADIGDLRAAKYIKPYLRQANPKKAPPLLATAVATAMEVPDPSLVGPLLKIVTTSKLSGIIEEAIQALGKFKSAKKLRTRILKTLVAEAKKVKPGARPRMRGGQEDIQGGAGGTTQFGRETGASARWAALSACVPSALSELTGQDIGGMEEWIRLVKQSRGKLGRLFVAK
jgi:hypothetical protein